MESKLRSVCEDRPLDQPNTGSARSRGHYGTLPANRILGVLNRSLRLAHPAVKPLLSAVHLQRRNCSRFPPSFPARPKSFGPIVWPCGGTVGNPDVHFPLGKQGRFAHGGCNPAAHLAQEPWDFVSKHNSIAETAGRVCPSRPVFKTRATDVLHSSLRGTLHLHTAVTVPSITKPEMSSLLWTSTITVFIPAT